jgi:hypothetical protein
MNLFSRLFGASKKNENNVKYSSFDYNVFFDNSIVNQISLEVLELGYLNLPTGRIVACDPLAYLHDADPLTKIVSPGKYPVRVYIAKTENSGDRYALVKLEFSNEKAMAWEMALEEGQDIKELKTDEYFGFPVDAGLGCFCDIEMQKTFNEWLDGFMNANPEGNIYDDFFAAEFKKNAFDQNDPSDIGDWLNFSFNNHPDLNVIMFHSGYGDGMYPCYWGISAEGNACSLIVDFQVI